MNKKMDALLGELERLCYVESRLGPNGKEWRLTEKGQRELAGLSGLGFGAASGPATASCTRPAN